MDENTPNADLGGFNRRDMLRRSALVGGALIWTAPAVQTLAAPAFAAGSTVNENPGTALSEVTLVLQCGTAGNYTYSWAKYTPQSGSGNYTECKVDLNVGESNTDATCTTAESLIDTFLTGKTFNANGCVNGSVSAEGVLCIDTGSCTVVAWTIHDGFGGSPNHCAYNVNGTQADNGNGGAFLVTQGAGSICFSKTV
jgi:hypothetical protein